MPTDRTTANGTRIFTCRDCGCDVVGTGRCADCLRKLPVSVDTRSACQKRDAAYGRNPTRCTMVGCGCSRPKAWTVHS